MTAKKPGAKRSNAGRPRKEPADFHIGWKKKMLDAYGKGKSNVWIKARVFDGVSCELWARWMNDPEFSITVHAGLRLSQAWWEDASQGHAVGKLKNGNAASIIFNMTNRFRDTWKQRQEVQQTVTPGFDRNDIEAVKDQLREMGIDPDSVLSPGKL